MLILCLLLLSSCMSTQKKIKPQVPDPYVDGVSVVTYDQTNDTVSMPYWYWLKLYDYIVETEETR